MHQLGHVSQKTSQDQQNFNHHCFRTWSQRGSSNEEDGPNTPPLSENKDSLNRSVENSKETASDSEKQGGSSFNALLSNRPPARVDDTSLLFYDVFLLINLTVSISFWSVHRLDAAALTGAVSEGSLLCLLWILAGVNSGAFLWSAVDGHTAEGGPQAAAKLGFNTFLNTVNLRLLVALLVAVSQHRLVGTGGGEEFLALEMAFGFVLMPAWRAMHSASVPRI